MHSPIARSILFITWLGMLFIGMPAVAQQPRADSLLHLLKQDLPDTTRAYQMIMLAMYTEPVDISQAHAAYRNAVDFALSKKLNYYAGLALSYEATPYHLDNNLPKQRENLYRAIDLFSRSDDPRARTELGSAYSKLSNYYGAAEQYDSAIGASLKAISIQEELGRHKKLVASCLNLAAIYQQLKLTDKQRQYVEKAMGHARLSGDPASMMLAYLRMAHYYTELNEHLTAKAYVDSAAPWFSEQYDFTNKQNFFLIKAATLQNIGDLDSAVYYFQRCYDLAKTMYSRWNMTEPLLQIGTIRFQQKRYADAETFLKKGLAIAEADRFAYFLKEGYGTLSEVFAATGRYKEAYELQGKHQAVKDSILSEERKQFALELEDKYESKKKEAQIKLQESSIRQKNILNAVLAGSIILLLIAAVVFYYSYRQRQRLQQQKIIELETEKKLLAAEAALKGEEQERTRLAKDLHDGLGGMLSGIKYSLCNMKGNLVMTPDNAEAFERSIDMLDNSIREMRRVAHNMMPEVLLRYGLEAALKDYCAEINKSGIVRIIFEEMGEENNLPGHSASLAIYRIGQELINNAIKHAGATEVLVQLFRENDRLLLNVEDNGRGFDPDQLEAAAGIGWSNIRSRAEWLNARLDVHSGSGKGSSVTLECKLS